MTSVTGLPSTPTTWVRRPGNRAPTAATWSHGRTTGEGGGGWGEVGEVFKQVTWLGISCQSFTGVLRTRKHSNSISYQQACSPFLSLPQPPTSFSPSPGYLLSLPSTLRPPLITRTFRCTVWAWGREVAVFILPFLPAPLQNRSEAETLTISLRGWKFSMSTRRIFKLSFSDPGGKHFPLIVSPPLSPPPPCFSVSHVHLCFFAFYSWYFFISGVVCTRCSSDRGGGHAVWTGVLTCSAMYWSSCRQHWLQLIPQYIFKIYL